MLGAGIRSRRGGAVSGPTEPYFFGGNPLSRERKRTGGEIKEGEGLAPSKRPQPSVSLSRMHLHAAQYLPDETAEEKVARVREITL